MTEELHLPEITTAKSGLLDSQVAHNNDSVNGALQTQWQVIRDGLAQGVSSQAELAKDNSLVTGVSMAGSFGLGAGLSWAMKAGGRWGAAAEVGAALFTGLMVGDGVRRWTGIQDTYSSTNGDTLQGQATRRDAIAQYAGSGIVEYSLMFASGGLGAASVHFGPRMVANLSTTLEPLGQFGKMESAQLVPVRSSNFRMMNLGETGNLGAKEIPSAGDPASVARNHLDFPHRQVGLDQLASLMEAKQLAAHPQLRPVFDQLGDTLGKVDMLKLQLGKDEQTLGVLQRELADAKSLKPEMQAVRSAESGITSLRAEMERIPTLREGQSKLTREIQEAKNANPANTSEDLRGQRREITDSISSIQARAQDLPRMQQRLTEANEAFGKRKKAIEAGEDPQVKELEGKMQPLQSSVESARAQLSSLTEQLNNLNLHYQTTADAIRPTLTDAASLPTADLPKYTKPKLEAPEPNRSARSTRTKADTSKTEMPSLSIEASATSAEAITLKIEVPQLGAPHSLTAALIDTPSVLSDASPMRSDTSALRKDTSASSTDTSTQRSKTSDLRQSGIDRQNVSERTSVAKPTERPSTESDVKRAASEAQQSVDDFAATHKRHTTALKKVNDYIGKAFSWFSGDPEAAAVNAPKVAQNVNALLDKLENWDRAPGWIRQADIAPTMQRNSFSPADMAKFDEWYQTQNKPFNDNGTMSPDRRLLEVQEHLSRRVAVESVKNWLRIAPEVESSVSPVVQDGFRMVAGGKLPDGRVIPKGSDMIVFQKVAGRGGESDSIVPFAKDGQHVQRFDDTKISEGLRKLDAMNSGGPKALSDEDLYGFRLDHDPSRLTAADNQVGYAVLRPGGQYGKNIMFMQFADDLDPALIPKSLRPDGPNGAGTNTGVLYNMVKNTGRSGASK